MCSLRFLTVNCFVQEIIPRLEAAEFVHKYSWFITRFNQKDISGDWYVNPKNALLMEDIIELTEFGKLYNLLKIKCK